MVIYLNVSYDKKDIAKKCGALWDIKKKKWYVIDNTYSEAIKLFKCKKVYLYVPFSEKNNAKNMGALWDSSKKLWYIYNNKDDKYYQILETFPCFDPNFKLVNENINFGGNKLYIDCIPKSCWFTNVRYCINKDDWDKLRKFIYFRAKYKCECCFQRKKLQAHERWSYNDITKTQKLERIIALCKKCHLTTHYGFACSNGYADVVYNHLKKINNYSSEEANKHIKETYKLYEERSKYEWKLDLSIIENSNISIIKPLDDVVRSHLIEEFIDEI